jgi:hypothetical protein
VAEQPPRPPVLLPLQIFFSFFHLALPPATISATASATVFTSAAPRLDHLGLHLGTHASGSTAPFVAACRTNSRSACSVITLHGCWIGPATMRAWAEPFGFDLAQKQRKKRICWADISPTFLGRYQPTVFWFYAWPSCLGRPGPHALIIFN